jgi:hypothetical protein
MRAVGRYLQGRATRSTIRGFLGSSVSHRPHEGAAWTGSRTARVECRGSDQPVATSELDDERASLFAGAATQLLPSLRSRTW